MFGKKKKSKVQDREHGRYYRQENYYGEDYDRSSRSGGSRPSSSASDERGSRSYRGEGRYASQERFSDVGDYGERGMSYEETHDPYRARRGSYRTELPGSEGERAREYRRDRYSDERRNERYASDGRRPYRGEADRRDENGRYRSGYAPDGRPAGRRRRKKKHTALKVILIILVALFALVAAGFTLLMGRVDRESLSNLVKNTGISQTGYTNIVFYGVDSRDTNGDMTSETHSDTIMICSINKKTGEIKLVSVYRDTYLDNTNGEYRKATECYYFGGPERSISMLNKNLDLDIEDYITVDFEAVIELIDALGGVDLEITDEEMTYINGYCVENKEVTGVDYEPLTTSGYVHLTGIQALAYCRIRYTEGWDYKRTERQRTIMNLCWQKAQQQGVTAMLALANNVLPNISTSMSNLEILSLVSGMTGYTIGEQTGFPFDVSTADLADAGDVVVPVTLASNVTQLHAFLFNEENYTPSDTVQEISAVISANTGLY